MTETEHDDGGKADAAFLRNLIIAKLALILVVGVLVFWLI